jgi:prepilin-type N-terminal cleavage/methylation domain-containing protein
VRIKTPIGLTWQRETTTEVFARTWRLPRGRGAGGFTLIELILVMALLVIAVSFVTPHLSGFFRGRTLTSEARQLIALMHDGQSRAVSGGVPMMLWFDVQEKKYGLEEEPGYSDKDPKAVEFPLNENLTIEVPENDSSISQPKAIESDNAHMNLPKITFLPDGSVAETSPKTVRIVDSAGPVISVTQSRDRNQYEIATTKE